MGSQSDALRPTSFHRSSPFQSPYEFKYALVCTRLQQQVYEERTLKPILSVLLADFDSPRLPTTGSRCRCESYWISLELLTREARVQLLLASLSYTES